MIFLMIFPCLCFANELSDQNLKQQEINDISNSYQRLGNDLNPLNIFNNYVDEVVNSPSGLDIESKLLPKGKPELQKILGTWIVSYSINRSGTFTDRLDINEVRQTVGGINITLGKLFLNGTGDGQTLRCAELNPELVSHFASDYSCFATDSQNFEQYVLRISEDRNVVGYYGQGETRDAAIKFLAGKTISLTGHREKGNGDSAHFDEETGELVIPAVSYKNSKFHVVLQDTGGLNFSVKEAQPIEDGNTSGSYFDKFSGELVIPSIIYRDSKFKIILQDNGSFVFSVKEATLL